MTTAMEVYRALGESYAPVDLFTGRGTHLGCGECCSRFLPVTDGELRVLRRAVRERGIRLRPEGADIDLTCPLLSEGNGCMAYDVRPMICRQYDCSEHARGVIRMHPFLSRCRTVDLREELR